MGFWQLATGEFMEHDSKEKRFLFLHYSPGNEGELDREVKQCGVLIS